MQKAKKAQKEEFEVRPPSRNVLFSSHILFSKPKESFSRSPLFSSFLVMRLSKFCLVVRPFLMGRANEKYCPSHSLLCVCVCICMCVRMPQDLPQTKVSTCCLDLKYYTHFHITHTHQHHIYKIFCVV
jgi:hypothetical protein